MAPRVHVKAMQTSMDCVPSTAAQEGSTGYRWRGSAAVAQAMRPVLLAWRRPAAAWWAELRNVSGRWAYKLLALLALFICRLLNVNFPEVELSEAEERDSSKHLQERRGLEASVRERKTSSRGNIR